MVYAEAVCKPPLHLAIPCSLRVFRVALFDAAMEDGAVPEFENRNVEPVSA